MPKVTHLTDTFYEDLTEITTCLQQGLDMEEYQEFYGHLKQKNFVAATKFLERILDERGDISFFALSALRSNITPWNAFYRHVADLIEEWEWYHNITITWIRLMIDNGGSKKVTKLTRKRRGRLPAPKPLKMDTSEGVIKFK